MPGKTANAGGLLLSASSSAHSPACTDAVLCRKAAHNLLISLNFELDVSKNRRTVIFYCQMPHQGVHKASGSDSMRLALGEGFPSGQRDQTVNLTALPSKVRILLPPPFLKCDKLKAIPRGGVPERPKGSDCKSDGSAFEGSNPSPSTIIQKTRPGAGFSHFWSAQSVIPLPSSPLSLFACSQSRNKKREVCASRLRSYQPCYGMKRYRVKR